VTAIDPERTLIQSSVVSAGLIAGKPAPTGISPAFRHALYLWEPRLPAMGREAALVTDFCYGSFAAIRDWPLSTQNGRCTGHQSRTDDLSGIARYPESPVT